MSNLGQRDKKGEMIVLLTFSLMVSDAEVCLRKTLAIPTLKDRSSGTLLLISEVIRWHPLEGAVIVTVRCAHPAVPVLIWKRRLWRPIRQRFVIRKGAFARRSIGQVTTIHLSSFLTLSLTYENKKTGPSLLRQFDYLQVGSLSY